MSDNLVAEKLKLPVAAITVSKFASRVPSTLSCFL
jgi:hypothetical protein